MLPAPAEVLAAAHRLRGIVERTPLIAAPALGPGVWLKCENLQRTGSFKLRGAYNALASLTDEERARGIVASSAGNHGLGVAHAARLLGVRARIFVPSSAPAVKRDGIVALGAEVDSSQPHYDAAHDAAVRHGTEHGMTYVNPCAGDALLAGQGTVALEILEELPAVQTIVVPVGGGGLLGGVAALVRAVAPHARIVGAQSERTNAMAASIEVGRRVDVPVPPTLADGLAGQVDEAGYQIGRIALDDIVCVTEDEIAASIAWMAREFDMRVEGSGAVGVAAVRAGLVPASGAMVVIVSGGNIDPLVWKNILSENS